MSLSSRLLSHICFSSIDLTKYGSHVYVLVRRGELRASKIMAKRLMNNSKIVSQSSEPPTSTSPCILHSHHQFNPPIHNDLFLTCFSFTLDHSLEHRRG